MSTGSPTYEAAKALIDYYEAMIEEYTITVKRLKHDFPKTSAATNGAASDGMHRFRRNEVPAEAIREFIQNKNAARPKSIADHLKVSSEDVNKAIDAHPELFEKADRGWIKLKTAA